MSRQVKQWAVILCLCCALAGCSSGRTSDGTLLGETAGEENPPEEIGTDPETAAPSEAVVYVCGCVAEPGVYTLDALSRIRDAVEAAGGFTEDADTEYWNLAEPVTDGEQIRIPSLEESAAMEPRTGSGGGTEDASSGLVNINTAAKEELMTLTGIGEVKAEAIIAYREANGGFASIEEIMNVSGIKEAGFAKIKDSITV